MEMGWGLQHYPCPISDLGIFIPVSRTFSKFLFIKSRSPMGRSWERDFVIPRWENHPISIWHKFEYLLWLFLIQGLLDFIIDIWESHFLLIFQKFSLRFRFIVSLSFRPFFHIELWNIESTPFFRNFYHLEVDDSTLTIHMTH